MCMRSVGVISMVTVPMDIKNALCDTSVQYIWKNDIIVGSDPDSVCTFSMGIDISARV